MSATLTLTPATAGIDHRAPLQQASADAANFFLSKNHEDHHLFFNDRGFHNHIVHHMMTVYALGATPEQLKQAFDTNVTYQKPLRPANEETVAKLEDKAYMQSVLGTDQCFSDLLKFFDRRMERDGWQNVVNEYLFSGTELAEEFMNRMFGGIWHPLLLFGFGVEFQQPLIVAEALAEAACHKKPYERYLLDSEKLAKQDKKSVPLVELVRQIQAEKFYQPGATFNEPLAGNAPQGLIELAAQWKVDSVEDLAYKTAESINVTAWLTGASQRADKAIKLDFVFMHMVNMSIFFSSFNKQSWISDADKIRLLEWQTRLNLLRYAAERAPPLRTEDIVEYVPREKDSSWEGVIGRVNEMRDDGHVSKMIRALAHGRDVSAAYEAADAGKAAQEELPMKGEMWLKMANMCWDSTVGYQGLRRWVRGAGHDEAWDEFGGRESEQ